MATPPKCSVNMLQFQFQPLRYLTPFPQDHSGKFFVEKEHLLQDVQTHSAVM